MLFAAFIALMVLPGLEAQTKKRLAILPFSGGDGQDGETISILLSNQRPLLNVFTVQPRNSAIDRIMGEQEYQRQSGLINSDAISAIGKLNTADLVVSGYITKLSDTNLILISIIDVTEVQQVAGVYQTYRSIEEIRGLLPALSERLAESSQKSSQDLPGLAIPSFSVPSNVNANDAMVLAQILATEIVGIGKYAVFPRNNSVDDVIKEHQFQRSGQTSGTEALGTTRNIEYILSSNVMSLGSTNLFGSQIISIERGDVLNGTDREYQDISDGLSKNLMRDIAAELMGVKISSVPPPVTNAQSTTQSSADTASGTDGTAAAADSKSTGNNGNRDNARNTRSGTSFGKRIGYSAMNLALGLGSYMQGDIGGGVVVTLGYGAAIGLITWELVGLSYYDALAGIPGTVGLGVAGATFVFGFIRPLLYNRNPQLASIIDRVNIVPAASERRSDAFTITYTHSF